MQNLIVNKHTGEGERERDVFLQKNYDREGRALKGWMMSEEGNRRK